MHKNDGNLNGALTGIAIAAAAHWARYDDGTQRALRNVRIDAEEALDLAREMQSRGEVMRSRVPTVMDAQVGLSIASPQPAAASVIPSTAPLTRPDLMTQMETAVADMSWPPEPGQYDERGLVKQAGELTSMFLALTYEEVRAFIQGLAQSRPPSRDGKVQIYYGASALVEQISEQKLSRKQYKESWGRLFNPEPPRASQPDVHCDPSRPPAAGTLGAGVASVVPLTNQAGGVPGYPYANRNTDRAMRFRLTTNAIIAAGMPLCMVSFGSEFRNESGPYQPVVLVGGDAPFLATAVSAHSFVVKSAQGLGQGQTYDFFVAVV